MLRTKASRSRPTLNNYFDTLNPQQQELWLRCKANMLIFGQVCFPTLFSVASPPFHYEIASDLHSDARFLNFIAPRGHAKSSLVAGVYPLYHIFFDEGPKFIVLSSKTSTHAEMLLQSIKDKLNYSMQLRSVVGYWGESTAKVWSNRMVVLKDNTCIVTKSTGQQSIGLKWGDQRPTLYIVDDPEDLENTKTVERMEGNLRWLLQSVWPCVDARRGRVVVIGTPQHQRCIVELLTKTKGWLSRRYKALQDDGSALWPELHPVEALLELKASFESVGRGHMFTREYQCEVVGEEDQLFKAEMLHEWEGSLHFDVHRKPFLKIKELDGKRFNKEINVPVYVFMGVDPASSTKQTADYSTIVTVAVDAKGRRFVLPYFRKRVTPLELADNIISYYRTYKPIKARIETTGYQEMLREYLMSKIYIPGFEIGEKPRDAKSRRLEQLQTIIARGLLYLHKGQTEMKDEMIMYPRGTHDDLLDGLYYACKKQYAPKHVVVTDAQQETRKKPLKNGWLVA